MEILFNKYFKITMLFIIIVILSIDIKLSKDLLDLFKRVIIDILYFIFGYFSTKIYKGE